MSHHKEDVFVKFDIFVKENPKHTSLKYGSIKSKKKKNQVLWV